MMLEMLLFFFTKKKAIFFSDYPWGSDYLLSPFSHHANEVVSSRGVMHFS